MHTAADVIKFTTEARNHITPATFAELKPGMMLMMQQVHGHFDTYRTYRLVPIERVFPAREQIQVGGLRYIVRRFSAENRLDFLLTDGSAKKAGRYNREYLVNISEVALRRIEDDYSAKKLAALGDEMLSALSNEKGRWLLADEITALQNVVQMINLRRQAEQEKRQKEQPVIEAALRNS